MLSFTSMHACNRFLMVSNVVTTAVSLIKSAFAIERLKITTEIFEALTNDTRTL